MTGQLSRAVFCGWTYQATAGSCMSASSFLQSLLNNAVSGTSSTEHPPSPQIDLAAKAATCGPSAERPACILRRSTAVCWSVDPIQCNYYSPAGRPALASFSLDALCTACIIYCLRVEGISKGMHALSFFFQKKCMPCTS